MDEVKNAYNNWWAQEDGRLASGFEAICGRFISKINETVDALFKFSSELFAIPFQAFKAEELWTVKPGFYYKFREDPVMLEVLATSFTLTLPKFLGDKIILKKMKEFLLQMIDRQGGRIRFDFAERLEKGKLDFRWEMLERLEATINGISSAIEKGMHRKSRGEQSVEERKGVLIETEKKLNEIKEELVRIQQKVST
jgi:hypothetical protein